jgi:hypothetical protein
MFPASIPGLNVELKLSGPLKTDVDVEGVVNPPITVTAPTMFEVPDILAVLTKVVAKLDVPEMFALVMKVVAKLDVPEMFALVMKVAPKLDVPDTFAFVIRVVAKLDVLETFKVVATTKGTVSVL